MKNTRHHTLNIVLFVLLLLALLAPPTRAADAKAVKWIDSITVSPVAVIQTADIDGESTFGAGLDAGIGINPYVSIHVAGYGYETDSWGGGAVDELESYVKANLASFRKQVVVITAKAGALWDTTSDEYAMSVGAGVDVNLSKRFALGADYSLAAWFSERNTDARTRFFCQFKF